MFRKQRLYFLILAVILTFLLAAVAPGQIVSSQNAPAVTATPTTSPTARPAAAAENFALTILHTNDVHAHHAPSDAGDGGEALASTVINQARASSPNNLLLNAGDNFTGTLFYVMHHGIDSSKFMNLMKYDAMTLGNHEFDEGDGNLALFIEQLKFPVVAANVDFGKSTALKNKTTPYVIINRGGEKIGVIGLANPETPSMSRPGSDLIFQSDLAPIVQAEVDKLTGQGVNKIIVLSHIGYQEDEKLAQAVTGVDIIVGGHTHTLLANFDNRAAGVYPAEVTNLEGKTTLVVQAGQYLEYVGKLDVEFDTNGELVSWAGDTIFLSRYITPDTTASALTKTLFAPIETLTRSKIGASDLDLQGDRTVCRFKECNLGNLITDAMRAETGAQVAFENGGCIRASIKMGDVTLGDVLTVLPFGNLISTLSLTGVDLKAALEYGVSQIDAGAGRFLQVSGMRYKIDPAQPVGSRVVSVEVLDPQGKYQALDPKKVYTVATNNFIAEGGDGFSVLAEKGLNPYHFGRPEDEVLTDYIKAQSPIKIDVEGRITFK